MSPSLASEARKAVVFSLSALTWPGLGLGFRVRVRVRVSVTVRVTVRVRVRVRVPWSGVGVGLDLVAAGVDALTLLLDVVP